MPWSYINSTKIKHTDGHTIELIAGSWREPMEIDPRINSSDGKPIPGLIRSGLAFAAKQPLTSTINKHAIKRPAQRPVLTLKKRESTN